MAGATGAVTIEEIPNLLGPPGTYRSENGSQEVYTVRFILHNMKHQRTSDSSEMVGTDKQKNHLNLDFALKSGGAKRTVFLLQ